MKNDYLIVGAGLFGAVCAHILSAAGKKCAVIDKRGHIGGNAYTDTVEGITVHRYGPHIFHTGDKGVWEYMNGFAEFNRFTNSPLAVYFDEVYNLPFNMNTFYQLWGIAGPAEAKKKIESQTVKYGCPKNLEEQALSLVGKDIYEKLIRGYTEKQWGRPCKGLPPFIIQRVPLRFTWDNSYFDDRYQGVPIGGYTPIVRKMLADCDVFTGIDYLDDRSLFDGIADKTIYTGPLDRFYGYRFGKLAYRTLQFKTQVLDESNYQGNAVVNYTDSCTAFTRIIEHKHFEHGTQPKTAVTWEYPAEASATGGEPYYPVNDAANNEMFEKYRRLSETEKNMLFGGRLADYQYYNMDTVIRKAMGLANSELGR